MSGTEITYGVSSPAVTARSTAAAAPADASDSGFSIFDTLLDIVNPLQHIPIVSNIYRNLTGDSQNAFSDIVGSTLFGGPISGAFAVASEMYKATAKEMNAQSDPKTAALAAAKSGSTEAAKTDGQKFAASTQDWLIGKTSGDASTPVTQTADAGYKRIMCSTKDWLNGSSSQNLVA